MQECCYQILIATGCGREIVLNVSSQCNVTVTLLVSSLVNLCIETILLWHCLIHVHVLCKLYTVALVSSLVNLCIETILGHCLIATSTCTVCCLVAHKQL